MIRIEKFLSESGIMSRREAQSAIKNGWVFLNGKKVSETGIKINPAKDTIDITPEAKTAQEEKMTVLVYKPKGVLSSKDKDGKNIFNIFPKYKNLNCVGRLDKDSEGLILLSNDGMITKALTGREHKVEKEYIVEIREDFLPWMTEKMISGIRVDSETLKATQAKRMDKKTFSITLLTGRKHQIRRMANALHLTIESLTRVRIGDLKIGKLKSGQSRKLTQSEIEKLRKNI